MVDPKNRTRDVELQRRREERFKRYKQGRDRREKAQRNSHTVRVPQLSTLPEKVLSQHGNWTITQQQHTPTPALNASQSSQRRATRTSTSKNTTRTSGSKNGKRKLKRKQPKKQQLEQPESQRTEQKQ